MSARLVVGGGLTFASVLAVDGQQLEAVVVLIEVDVDSLLDFVQTPVGILNVETHSRTTAGEEEQDDH